MRRYRILLLGMIICGLTILGTSHDSKAKKKVKVTVKSVSVTSQTGNTVYVAQDYYNKLTTKVKVSPNKSKYKKVTYKSKDKTIAKVSSKGRIYGVKVGKTTITVTSKKNKKKKKVIKVNVTEPIERIRLSEEEHWMKPGTEYTIVKKILPDTGCYKKISIESSNPAVATVTSDGIVTAVGLGDATITLRARDGSGVKSQCVIHVVDEKTILHTDIMSVKMLSAREIQVELNRPQELKKNDFNIRNKCLGDGNFIMSNKVESIATEDSRVYKVTLEADFPLGRYMRVSIPELDGTYYMDILARLTVDSPIHKNITQNEFALDYRQYTLGDVIYQVSDTGDDITYEERDGRLYFMVKKELISSHEVRVDVTDELGDQIQYILNFTR